VCLSHGLVLVGIREEHSGHGAIEIQDVGVDESGEITRVDVSAGLEFGGAGLWWGVVVVVVVVIIVAVAGPPCVRYGAPPRLARGRWYR